VIVVVGSPLAQSTEGRVVAAGRSAEIATAIAAAGPDVPVQLVGRVGDDPTADAVLGDLSGRGVGHVAILRDVAHPTPLADSSSDPGAVDRLGLEVDAQDVALALRYLTDIAVLVVTPGLSSAVLATIADAAGWSGAAVVLVGPGIAADSVVVRPAAIPVERALAEDGAAFVARVADLAVRQASLRSVR
jgi:hypothetical protein